MAIPTDDGVVVRRGSHACEPTEITINCPDKVGLGCDIARTIFEFGLNVVKGDLSTDGRWCFIVFWVAPRTKSGKPIKWSLLKYRLEAFCPSSAPSLVPRTKSVTPKPKELFLIQISSADRTGLLNDVTRVLWEVELTIQKVNVTISPDDTAVDLIFVTDNRDELPAQQRIDDVCFHIRELLGKSIHCEISPAGQSNALCGTSPTSVMPYNVAKYLLKLSSNEEGQLQKEGNTAINNPSIVAFSKNSPKAFVSIDNALSPVHSMLQIEMKDRKGLVYDCLRFLRDVQMKIAYGRIMTSDDGTCSIDMFVQDSNGNKLVDESLKEELCLKLRKELESPIHITMIAKGPDSELLVGTPVEVCGRGRPRVLYDVSTVLRNLELHIFKADISRHRSGAQEWEVYRFLIHDKFGQPVLKEKSCKFVENQVRITLMG